MQLPPILRGDSLTRLIQGAIGGAVLTMALGFAWGGWTLGSTAAKMADDKSRAAVVTALAPICVDNFQRAANAPANLAELKKAASWEQRGYVEKGGWAKVPGGGGGDYAVAEACANLLTSLK